MLPHGDVELEAIEESSDFLKLELTTSRGDPRNVYFPPRLNLRVHSSLETYTYLEIPKCC